MTFAVMQKGKSMRLIDGDKIGLTDFEIIMCNGDYKEALKMLLNKIDNAPTIAQPEIIHCRDCKHYYFADNRIPQEQRYVCDISGEIWQPDDYCSYGERREVGE